MIGIAPKLEITQVYYCTQVFRKAKTPGVPEKLCIICGFGLDNHKTIDVLDAKGKKHTIHMAHIDA